MSGEVRYFAIFSEHGDPIGFYPSDVHPEPPNGAIEITGLQWLEMINNQGRCRYVGGEVVAYDPPPDPPSPRVVYKADIWRRASNAEADIMDAMLDSQPARLRRMWADAVNLSEDDDLFPVIRAALVSEFGEDRADELLA